MTTATRSRRGADVLLEVIELRCLFLARLRERLRAVQVVVDGLAADAGRTSELLEERLGRRVEVVTLEALSPFIGPRILTEAEDVLRAA